MVRTRYLYRSCYPLLILRTVGISSYHISYNRIIVSYHHTHLPLPHNISLLRAHILQRRTGVTLEYRSDNNTIVGTIFEIDQEYSFNIQSNRHTNQFVSSSRGSPSNINVNIFLSLSPWATIIPRHQLFTIF